MKHKFKVGDKVVVRTPWAVNGKYRDVVGELIEVIDKEHGRIQYPDGVIQITCFEDDGVELVEDSSSKSFDPVSKPSHYNHVVIESNGGPSSYYDFEPDWNTWNDFADYKAQAQWKEHSFHLGNVGKSICRWGDKGGTTKSYDARKIVYSGLRVLMMIEGKEDVRKYLDDLRENPQFSEGS